MEPGIGIDIIEIPRMEAALARRPALARRCFTHGEQAYCAARARSAPHFAARFAAKEAVAKALGRSLSWQEVEVVRDDAGRPGIRLHGRAQGLAGSRPVLVSLSHCDEYAVACAMVLPRASHEERS
jgi:holo-[acyl-carrier protein] synthase